MARQTGKAGAASIGALSAIILDSWEYEETSSNVEITAAGDTATERAHLRLDWRVTVRGYLSATPPYAMLAIPVGTEAVVALKILIGDSAPWMTDTGLVVRGRVEHPHDGPTRIEAEIVSSDGSAMPTFDTTPAS